MVVKREGAGGGGGGVEGIGVQDIIHTEAAWPSGGRSVAEWLERRI